MFIPLSFFPESLQKLMFVLPFQFITYVPTRVFIGSYELAGHKLTIPQIIGLQGIAVCAYPHRYLFNNAAISTMVE